PVPERRDVRDERVDLRARKEETAAARLLARLLQRHVAGAQVEVGRERADAAERRPDPRFDLLVAGRPAADDRARLRLAFAVRPVAHRAVAAVHLLAVCRDGRPGEREQEREESETSHSWWHVRSTTVAIVDSTTIIAKMTFAPSEATAKNFRRADGGGPCSSAVRTARKTKKAATSAAARQRSANPPSASATVSYGMPKRRLPGLHTACEVPMPPRNERNQMLPPARKPNHCRNSRRRRLIAR